MNILILGSGGREYSIGLAISKEEEQHDIYFMPGNGATGDIGTNINIKIIMNLPHGQKRIISD
jgi:phosphoribosylamine--glycine ligase